MAGVVLERAIAGLRDRETSLQITVSCAKTQTSAAPWDKNTQCAVLSISQKRCATLGAQTPLDLLISTALRGIHEKAPSGFSYSWPWIGMISSGGWRCSASYAAAGAIRIRHFPVATLPERPHLHIDIVTGLVILPDGSRHSIRETYTATPSQRIGYPYAMSKTGLIGREDVVPIHPDAQIVVAASVALGMFSRASADRAVAASLPLGPTRDQIRLALALVFGPSVLLRGADHTMISDNDVIQRTHMRQDWLCDPKALTEMEDFRAILSVAGHDRDYLPTQVVVTPAMQASLDEIKALGLSCYTTAGEEIMAALHRLNDGEVLLMLAILELHDGAAPSHRTETEIALNNATHHAKLSAQSKIASARKRIAALITPCAAFPRRIADDGRLCA